MKREEIKAIFPDATDEQLDKVMAINGTDVEKVRTKLTAAEAELEDKKTDFDRMSTELEALRQTGATADEWKEKFEALKAENEAAARQAEADRIAAEKAAEVKSRFEVCVGEKQFSHDAVRESYLKRFGDALESDEYKGKGDADIFHDLTKDDAAAFSGVTAVRLAGGNPAGAGGSIDDATARAIMGLPASK